MNAYLEPIRRGLSDALLGTSDSAVNNYGWEKDEADAYLAAHELGDSIRDVVFTDQYDRLALAVLPTY